MKIQNGSAWYKWKTLADYLANVYRTRNCRKICGDCKTDWKRIETEHAHYINVIESGKNLTKYICDGCLEERKVVKVKALEIKAA